MHFPVTTLISRKFIYALLAGSSEFPSLGTGITSAIFHALGKAAFLNELFTSLEITATMLLID